MSKIVTYLVVNNNHNFLSFADKYKTFFNSTDALTHARVLGYENPMMPLPDELEVGMGYVYKTEGIDIAIIPLEII